jgi:hypothetical protein
MLAPFRKMVVDLDRPQIPHSLSVASFRKMIVRLDRLSIPHSLPLASFRKMVVDLDRPQIPHSLSLASFRKMVVRLDRPHIPHRLPVGFVRRDIASPVIPAFYSLPTAHSQSNDCAGLDGAWDGCANGIWQTGSQARPHSGRLQDSVVAGVSDPGTLAGIRWRTRLRRCEPRRQHQKTCLV